MGNCTCDKPTCNSCNVCKPKPEVCGCKLLLSSKCVIHEGGVLDVLGIQPGDTLESILIKIEDYITNLTEQINTIDVTNQIEEYLTNNLCTLLENCGSTGGGCVDLPVINNFSHNCTTDEITFTSENTLLVTIGVPNAANSGEIAEVVLYNGIELNLENGTTYTITGYSNQGCASFVTTYTTNCTETCTTPILKQSFSYDCNTSVITVSGDNIASVTISGISGNYQNGDILPTSLVNGQNYTITYIATSERCPNATSSYTANCPVSTPILLSNITYTCNDTETIVNGDYTSTIGLPDTINFTNPSITIIDDNFYATTFDFTISNADLVANEPIIFSISNGSGSSDNFTFTYNNDCCDDVLITNPIFSYSCSSGFVTYFDDNAPGYSPIQSAELFDSNNVSIGTFFPGSTHSIPDGNYSIVWTPKDSNCPTVNTNVVIDCTPNDLQVTNYSIDCIDGIMVLTGTYSSDEPLSSISADNSTQANNSGGQIIDYNNNNFSSTYNTANDSGTFYVELLGGINGSNTFDLIFRGASPGFYTYTINGVTACDEGISFAYFCNIPNAGDITLAFNSANHNDFTIAGVGTFSNGGVINIPNGDYDVTFNHNNSLADNTISYNFNC